MATISQIQINGTTYEIADATARESISQLNISRESVLGDTISVAQNAVTKLLTISLEPGLTLLTWSWYVVATSVEQNIQFAWTSTDNLSSITQTLGGNTIQTNVGDFNSAKYHLESCSVWTPSATSYFLYGTHGGTGTLNMRAHTYIIHIPIDFCSSN